MRTEEVRTLLKARSSTPIARGNRRWYKSIMAYDFSSVIDGVVRERFGNVIEAVRVFEERDFEGDRIFRVHVVFNGKGPLDDELTSSVIRHIRARLREEKDDTFPIISFTSSAEATEMKSEAA